MYWNSFVNILGWKKVWLLPHKYIIVNKVREVSFKLIHRFYPANSCLKMFKPDIVMKCNFGKMDQMKLLYICFGNETIPTFADILLILCTLVFLYFGKIFLFGFVNIEKNIEKEFYLIHLLLLLAKFHIHKCKFSNL